ncbi:MAG: hypothetical protein RL477_1920 [Pseudomonadota bacterium]
MSETPAKIVMIEDSPIQAALTTAMLKNREFVLFHGATGAKGLNLVREIHPDVVLLDINLPDVSGLTILDRLVGERCGAPVIMVTGDSEIETVVDCMRRGAFDYVAKPFNAERIRVTVRNAVERRRMMRLIENYRLPYEAGFHGMIGISPPMVAVYRIIEAAAPSDAPVFITGASGTGKELAAEAIHRLSRRLARPMVALNCAALPESLAESELFGHARGAFTGAHSARAGAVETAEGGTLFLDEIGEMAPALQAKLLRFLQGGVYRRVGDTRERRSDVRIVAATNRDPREMIRDGLLREDLYYRLRVIPLHLPPLAERGDDILAVARHFLACAAGEEKKEAVAFTPDAEAWIRVRAWPGNVRELENAIRCAVVLAQRQAIGVEDMTAAVAGAGERAVSGPALAEIERRAIETAIETHGGSIAQAARQLGIDPSTIHRKRRTWRRTAS